MKKMVISVCFCVVMSFCIIAITVVGNDATTSATNDSGIEVLIKEGEDTNEIFKPTSVVQLSSSEIAAGDILNHITESKQFEVYDSGNKIMDIDIICSYYVVFEGGDEVRHIDKLEARAIPTEDCADFTWRTSAIYDEGDASVELCYLDDSNANQCQILLWDLGFENNLLSVRQKIITKDMSFWPTWARTNIVALSPKFHNTIYDVERVGSKIVNRTEPLERHSSGEGYVLD